MDDTTFSEMLTQFLGRTHIGSKLNNLGPSYVTLTFLLGPVTLRAARRKSPFFSTVRGGSHGDDFSPRF